MPIRLPQELIDCIVDYTSDDIPALKSLALTSPTFVARCQKYIFLRIVLSGPPRFDAAGALDCTACSKLHAIISASPHLAGYVRHLTIGEVVAIPNMERTLEVERARRDGVQWIMNDATLPPLFQILTRLDTIVVDAVATGSSRLTLPPALLASITAAFRSPVLSRLELSHVRNLPLDVLGSFHSLKDLKLTLITFGNEPSRPDSRQRRSHLDSLTVKLSRASLECFVDWLLRPECPLSVTHLYKLAESYFWFPSKSTTSRLLQATSRSLREFEVGHSAWSTSPPVQLRFLDLRFYPNLRRLYLSISYSSIPMAVKPLLRTAYTLETIAATNDLREIAFECAVLCRSSAERYIHDLKSIDNILMRSHFLRLLRVVVVVVSPTMGDGTSELITRFRSAMPALDAAGLLSVEEYINRR